MSAFIVNDRHINILVSYAIAKKMYFDGAKVTEINAQKLAQMLFKANVQSVNYRYSSKEKFTGFKFKIEDISSFSPADIFRLAQCLEYQSCELKAWQKSAACRLISAISINAAWDLSEIKNSTMWSI